MSAAALGAAILLSMTAADDVAMPPPIAPHQYICSTSDAERVQA
jgi:hypothetical protein